MESMHNYNRLNFGMHVRCTSSGSLVGKQRCGTSRVRPCIAHMYRIAGYFRGVIRDQLAVLVNFADIIFDGSLQWLASNTTGCMQLWPPFFANNIFVSYNCKNSRNFLPRKYLARRQLQLVAKSKSGVVANDSTIEHPLQ